MNDGLEKLKAIGAQKIHEKTHISKYHVQSLLHNSFDDMSKIQFLGFVSILEREYSIHLDDLRQKGLEHFTSRRVTDGDNKIFVQPKKVKSNALMYILMLLVLFIFGMVYTFSNVSREPHNIHDVQKNETIQAVQEEILKLDLDANLTDVNGTDDVNQTLLDIAPAPIASLVIIPNTKLWLGYIDLSTHKKLQITTAQPITLDPAKNWLLSLGHGDISVDVNGQIQKFNNPSNIRFLYQDGVFKEISFKEFKSLNKGAIW